MISALEREVLEKFRLLDPDAKQRVLEMIEHETAADVKDQTKPFKFDRWWAQIEAVRITANPDASDPMPTASDLVNEVREERDADILRSLGFRNSTGDSTG